MDEKLKSDITVLLDKAPLVLDPQHSHGDKDEMLIRCMGALEEAAGITGGAVIEWRKDIE